MSSEGIRRIINVLENVGETDFSKVVTTLEFKPTSKKPLKYKFFSMPVTPENIGSMNPMSYGVTQDTMTVETHTADGKETTNTANKDDVIMSGPSREKYVIKSAKFPKLYNGKMGAEVVPDQTPRQVAQYPSSLPATELTASWGETMPVKPGDYVVKDGDTHYYRIAKKEYEETYNPPGKIG